jgi:4'-phosphopantetheinyl transferase
VIARGQVDLWWADLAGRRPTYAEPDDRSDASRVVDTCVRRRLLARRAILRDLLSRYLDCGPGELVLARTGSGRPELAWPRSGLSFSVSSSGETALFAIANGAAIGVDIEESRRCADLTGAERLFLADAERRIVCKLEPRSRGTALLQLWTLKEALAKAIGTGLGTDPTELEFDFEPGRPPSVVAPPGASSWRAGLISTSPGVVGALAGRAGWDTCEQHRYVPAAFTREDGHG